MDTEILQEYELEKAIAWIKSGEVAVFPTETVYGLGARLFSDTAIQKIFTIKNRPQDNPLIVHASSTEEAANLGFPPPSFFKLAEAFWPGPLTMVIPRREMISPLVCARHSTIAIRVPSHPTAQKIIRGVGEPIVAPSANLSGRPSATSALDAAEDLSGKVRYIVDGGASLIGIESTVIHLIDDQVTLLRPGPILIEEIEKILGVRVHASHANLVSPGMKYRHYAPKAKVRIAQNEQDLKSFFVLSPQPKKGQFLLTARTLYAAFREADRMGAFEIIIDSTPELRHDHGLMNRILKAAENS
jgi:L-threonylcarbamoyladenylate synthase